MITKNNKTELFIYPVAFLILISIVLQIISIFIPSIKNLTAIILFLITQILAPITFFLIVYLLRKEPKAKFKTYKIILIMLGIIILNYLLSIGFHSIVSKSSSTTASNPIIGIAKTKLLITIISLAWAMFGEEAIKLSLFFIFFKGWKYNKENKMKYWLSWIIVSILFGLFHLSTYKYNFLQCIFIIGIPSILYGYLWKKTENPFLMWGTHFSYDTILILISLLIS